MPFAVIPSEVEGPFLVDVATKKSLRYASLRSAPIGMTGVNVDSARRRTSMR